MWPHGAMGHPRAREMQDRSATRLALVALAALVVALGALGVFFFAAPDDVARDAPPAPLPVDAAVSVPDSPPDAGPPPRVQRTLAAGLTHTCAVRADGTLACWGNDTSGQLGVDGMRRSRTPIVVPGQSDIVEIALGLLFTCALDASGHVACWGANDEGQLGDGTSEARATPARVSGVERAVSIAAGRSHACALADDGEVWCWGEDDFGRGHLRVGAAPLRTRPTRIAGAEGSIAVTAGDAFTCVLRSSGRVACWGLGAYGRLGDDTVESRHEPRDVIGVDDVVEIAAGTSHTCARRANAEVWCWGSGSSGELGPGPMQSNVARRVEGLDDVVELAAGGDHTCARRASGRVTCWGADTDGQLGEGTPDGYPHPELTEVASIEDAVAIAAGGWHTCARRATGAIVCWGRNEDGQLGDGSSVRRRATPAEVSAP